MTEKQMEDLRKQAALDFGRNLSNILNMRSLKPTDLAKMLDVSDTIVGAWLNGNKMPRMPKIDRMCELLSTNRAYLLSSPNSKEQREQGHFMDPETAKLAQEAYEDPDVKVLLKAKKNLPPEVIKRFIDMIKEIDKEH